MTRFEGGKGVYVPTWSYDEEKMHEFENHTCRQNSTFYIKGQRTRCIYFFLISRILRKFI